MFWGARRAGRFSLFVCFMPQVGRIRRAQSRGGRCGLRRQLRGAFSVSAPRRCLHEQVVFCFEVLDGIMVCFSNPQQDAGTLLGQPSIGKGIISPGRRSRFTVVTHFAHKVAIAKLNERTAALAFAFFFRSSSQFVPSKHHVQIVIDHPLFPALALCFSMQDGSFPILPRQLSLFAGHDRHLRLGRRMRGTEYSDNIQRCQNSRFFIAFKVPFRQARSSR